MTIWIKTLDGRAVQLKDSRWRAKIYASGSVSEDLDYLLSRVDSYKLIHSTRYVYKRADLQRVKKSRVLEIELENAARTRTLAELLEGIFQNPDSLQLYNVDVMPEQQYFYEKDLFPLAFVEVDTGEEGEVRRWNLLDNATRYDYETPKFKILRLAVQISDLVPRFESRLRAVILYSPDENGEVEKELARIEGPNEAEILRELATEISKYDPDLIMTQNGDSFVLPFLYSKATKFGIDLPSVLNRDRAVRGSAGDERIGGKTYFSYGRILYRPSTHRLFGRLHLDEQNTFVYDQCMLEGLYEVSRLCRIPIHTSMRASIGKCLSSLQFYYAFKGNILIPWKPDITEDFKSGYELLNADRGGLVLKPLPGVHEHVGEVDFASLYPSIIRKYNISAETVNCSCCRDFSSPSKFQIEELRMHVCDKQEGIVSRSLALPLSKRFEYKRLRDQTQDERLKKAYNERAGSLKWILVCCLAGEMPVLVKRQNEAARHVKIGFFIDNILGGGEGIFNCPDGVSVLGVDRNFKSKFCKVKKVLKIPNERKLLSITMEDHSRIALTPNHPCYLFENGQLQVKEASELRKGDFIPLARKLDESTVEGSGELLQKGDLGFARIDKIDDRTGDDYVYCFELDDDEVPGFFAGDGAIFTHNCFGYLSYRNAKFGKIDSHIAVCALARKTLVEAMHTSEYNGFRVVHGIVDSLWLSKRHATLSDYEELREKIEANTGFRLAIEGIYKWIIFLPSKTYSGRQVANRYFGAFEGPKNELKVRGIELRRRDTPLYFKKCQQEILTELARCSNEKELRSSARWKCVEIFEKNARALEDHRVPATELIIRRRMSKNPNEYSSQRQLSVNAASRLAKEGLTLQAGQSISYVITHYRGSGVNRSVPEELISPEAVEYDSRRYVELLADCYATVLFPLGVSKEELLTRSRSLLSW